MLPFSFNFDVGCDIFGLNFKHFLNIKHFGLDFFHLSTDKSTGKSYLSGATNVRLGQHGQLISPHLTMTLNMWRPKYLGVHVQIIQL